MTTSIRTRRLTLMAMFAALAYILMAVGRIPITSVDFLKYDPKDVILVICGFTMGAVPALGVTAIVALIEMISVSTSGFIGMVMNLIASAMFVCPAAVIYKRRHSARGAIAGLVAGVLAMTGIMLLWNYFVTPVYMGYPRKAVAEMLVPLFLPFNLVKGGINAAIVMLVYKPISRALRRSGLLLPDENEMKPTHKRGVGMKLVAALVLASCVLGVLAMRGVI